MLWFNFILGSNFIFLCFKLIIIHYHIQKQREIKFEQRIKLNHNIYMGIVEGNVVVTKLLVSKETIVVRWQASKALS